MSKSKPSFGNPPNHEWATRFVEAWDFGLSEEQEEHARELHKSITIFDTLIEVTWYYNFIANVQQGALGAGAAGSMTLGGAGLKYWRGKGEEVVATPMGCPYFSTTSPGAKGCSATLCPRAIGSCSVTVVEPAWTTAPRSRARAATPILSSG